MATEQQTTTTAAPTTPVAGERPVPKFPEPKIIERPRPPKPAYKFNTEPKAKVEDFQKGAVPLEVDPVQIRKALSRFGYRDMVEAAIAKLGGEVADQWEFDLSIHRDSAVARVMETTKADVDALFRLAATL